MTKPIDTSKMITGQVIMRSCGDGIKGRKKYSFVGIVDIPDGDVAITDDYQYVAFGRNLFGQLTIVVDLNSGVELEKRLKGDPLCTALTEPIWRT